MNEQQKQAFENQLNQIPPMYRDAIRAVPWEAKTIEIGQKHKLFINQIDELMSEVALVLVGLVTGEVFRKRVADKLDIEYELADELIRELNLEIFERVREIVKNATPPAAPQSVPIQTNTVTSTAPQFFQGVTKVAPEKHTITSLEKKPINIDPYHEPIE